MTFCNQQKDFISCCFYNLYSAVFETKSECGKWWQVIAGHGRVVIFKWKRVKENCRLIQKFKCRWARFNLKHKLQINHAAFAYASNHFDQMGCQKWTFWFSVYISYDWSLCFKSKRISKIFIDSALTKSELYKLVFSQKWH